METEYIYPENAYCEILGKGEYSLPVDAEKSLEYVLNRISIRESDFFMKRFLYEMTYQDIGDKSGLSKEHTRRIIQKACRKLRHPYRSKILKMGLEEYLKSQIDNNELQIQQYEERVREYESLLEQQKAVLDSLTLRLADLGIELKNTGSRLHLPIEVMGLTTRSYNSLARAGMKTVKDIIQCDDLRAVRNLGRASYEEIKEKLRLFIEDTEA